MRSPSARMALSLAQFLPLPSSVPAVDGRFIARGGSTFVLGRLVVLGPGGFGLCRVCDAVTGLRGLNPGSRTEDERCSCLGDRAVDGRGIADVTCVALSMSTSVGKILGQSDDESPEASALEACALPLISYLRRENISKNHQHSHLLQSSHPLDLIL